MNHRLVRSASIRTALEGTSFIDNNKIHIHSQQDAYNFILSYGYDLNDDGDYKELLKVKEEAVSLIQEELLDEGESIPEAVLNEGVTSVVATWDGLRPTGWPRFQPCP